MLDPESRDRPLIRLGVARGVVHFTLVAYLLLGLFRWTEQADGAGQPASALIPEVELAVYAGNNYALLTAGEVVEIVLDYPGVWLQNRARILAALRLAERQRDTS